MDGWGSDCDMDNEMYHYFFATEFVEKMNLGSPLMTLQKQNYVICVDIISIHLRNGRDGL